MDVEVDSAARPLMDMGAYTGTDVAALESPSELAAERMDTLAAAITERVAMAADPAAEPTRVPARLAAGMDTRAAVLLVVPAIMEATTLDTLRLRHPSTVIRRGEAACLLADMERPAMRPPDTEQGVATESLLPLLITVA